MPAEAREFSDLRARRAPVRRVLLTICSNGIAMLRRWYGAAAAVIFLVGAPADGVADGPAAAAATMASGGSMARQNAVAHSEGYSFMRTPADVWAQVARGALIHADNDGDYRLANVSFPVARPEVIVFLEHLAADYRAACGERLVVTSLTRPINRQPSNSSRLSVHPAGMAIDLRIPAKAECRRWLEARLLELQAADLLEVIRERRPPHYHVGLFPAAYREFLEAEVAAERARMRAYEEAEETRLAVLSGRAFGGPDGSGSGGLLHWLILLLAAPTALVLAWARRAGRPQDGQQTWPG
jgi:hypothetical protein